MPMEDINPSFNPQSMATPLQQRDLNMPNKRISNEKSAVKECASGNILNFFSTSVTVI